LVMLSAVHHSRGAHLVAQNFLPQDASGRHNAGPSFRIVIVAVLLDSACADRYRCRGDGFVYEDGCDGGGGGEGFGDSHWPRQGPKTVVPRRPLSREQAKPGSEPPGLASRNSTNQAPDLPSASTAATTRCSTRASRAPVGNSLFTTTGLHNGPLGGQLLEGDLASEQQQMGIAHHEPARTHMTAIAPSPTVGRYVSGDQT
jgi:hypothetical protein